MASGTVGSGRRAGQTLAGARRRRKSLVATALIAILCGLLALGINWGGMRARAALDAYRDAVADAESLRTVSDLELTQVSAQDAERIAEQFTELSQDLDRLQQATDPPWKTEWLVERLPYVGERYDAARTLLSAMDLYVAAGMSGASIGRDVLRAYELTGLSTSATPQSPTWLDVLSQREADIRAIRSSIQQANQMRAGLDARYLPDRATSRLDELDAALARVDLDRLIDEQLPLLRSALGADAPARYLILFQNPAELRPSGGFPGTVALITIERGQLRGYEFYDIYDLNQAYLGSRHEPIPQPWALEQFAATGELTILDASWWSDFPRSGATVMRMYGASGWPPIVGLATVDPALVSDLLLVTGPLVVDVDGELRTITPDNVHDEIERQRRLHREGERDFDTHKQVLALIGKEIIEQLKAADRDTTRLVADVVMAAADRRDLQVYFDEPRLMDLAEERGWTGRLQPEPTTPTLAITFANVAFGKSSQLMHPSYRITLGSPRDGVQQVTLEIDMRHTGSEADDPFYTGFQRWWIEVSLPDGSRLISSTVPSSADPSRPNGGAYEVGLHTGERATLVLSSSIPVSDTLLLRRQPGLTDAQVSVQAEGCNVPFTARLTADLVLDLGSLCRP